MFLRLKYKLENVIDLSKELNFKVHQTHTYIHFKFF